MSHPQKAEFNVREAIYTPIDKNSFLDTVSKLGRQSCVKGIWAKDLVFVLGLFQWLGMDKRGILSKFPDATSSVVVFEDQQIDPMTPVREADRGVQKPG